MKGHVSPGSYKDVVLFLATAGVIVPLFRRWKISPILGFLGAGVVLGPSGLGAMTDQVPWFGYFTIANPEEVAQLAEFGVVFLLFMVGQPDVIQRYNSAGGVVVLAFGAAACLVAYRLMMRIGRLPVERRILS